MKKLKQLVPEDNLTTEPIPFDLLIDIFSRLPSSKYVARFRCLSKSWASILVHPYFTELFLTKSASRPRLLFTVSDYDKLLFFSTPQTLNSSVVTTCYKTHSSHHEVTSPLLHGRLVCCTDGRSDYDLKPVICNPATGELLTIPPPNSSLCQREIYCGYDPTGKKFKFLCIAACLNTNWAWVMTLETGKLLWRKIECEYHNSMFPFFTHRHMICIDGVLYYLACRSEECLMVCFDVKSEKFSFINIDDDSMHTCGSTLINYKGRLGVAQFTDSNQRILRLWLLEDDAAGMINKWSMNIYELPLSWKHPPTKTFQIVGMTRTCDIVLAPYLFSDPFYVFYYNVERKTLVARTEIQGLQKLKSHRPVVCVFQDYVEDVKLMKSLY